MIAGIEMIWNWLSNASSSLSMGDSSALAGEETRPCKG